MGRLKLGVLLLVILSMVSCSALVPSFESPTVTISNFRVLPGQSIVPTFEIGLHVSNPNRMPLNLVGLSYLVELEGHQVFSGVANDLPVIAGYGSGNIVLQGQPDLIGTFNLFHDLMRRPRQDVSYRVDAVLDIGGLMPKIRINREGLVSLNR